ncbi:MAG: carboxypeptidase regulatory-like domain-containing protein [Flavobacteriales bacterium]|nr:carboxypeptidase regulatory-like domain-containing protein [Flavobacteriales bacterium]
MNLKALNLVAGILSSASLLAQNTALRGIIKDKGDLPLAEAHIVLEDSVGIVKYETRSTGDGRYVVEQVAPSTYVVVVHKSGFQASRQNGILVADGKQNLR